MDAPGDEGAGPRVEPGHSAAPGDVKGRPRRILALRHRARAVPQPLAGGLAVRTESGRRPRTAARRRRRRSACRRTTRPAAGSAARAGRQVDPAHARSPAPTPGTRPPPPSRTGSRRRSATPAAAARSAGSRPAWPEPVVVAGHRRAADDHRVPGVGRDRAAVARGRIGADPLPARRGEHHLVADGPARAGHREADADRHHLIPGAHRHDRSPGREPGQRGGPERRARSGRRNRRTVRP